MVKIKINYLFFVLMILGIFEPAYFEDGNLHIFFVVCKLISLIFLFDFKIILIVPLFILLLFEVRCFDTFSFTVFAQDGLASFTFFA